MKRKPSKPLEEYGWALIMPSGKFLPMSDGTPWLFNSHAAATWFTADDKIVRVAIVEQVRKGRK